MKTIASLLLFAAAITGCRQARVIATPESEGFFKQENPAAKSEAPAASYTTVTASPAAVYEEFKNLGIPMQAPAPEYPGWQSFYTLLQLKQSQLSANGAVYAAQLLLNGYRLYEQPYSAALAAAMEEQVERLTAARYRGYALLYHCLAWLKQHAPAGRFAGFKTTVLAYAKPVLGAPNPNLPNSPEIENNPALKADMDRMIARAKENDGYIEKIKLL